MQGEARPEVKPYAAQAAKHVEKLRVDARRRKQAQRDRERQATRPPAERYRELAERFNHLDELCRSEWTAEREHERDEVGEALDRAQEDLWQHNLDALNPAERAE
jgi:hypothetical protein